MLMTALQQVFRCDQCNRPLFQEEALNRHMIHFHNPVCISLIFIFFALLTLFAEQSLSMCCSGVQQNLFNKHCFATSYPARPFERTRCKYYCSLLQTFADLSKSRALYAHNLVVLRLSTLIVTCWLICG
ncbi:hypothetical protein FB192DRAFT_1164003 [Mucor lusitanicus]|uniref:C2H2-type domain-containing protein n=1 Tax=Mucor circinelloides f. lusitanicus TaxID=29924 RepID=A0A8H4EX86_MUCCL|nr:hypothetical protein FB192DRAFT_1164003 [Mucor lusitanicus]